MMFAAEKLWPTPDSNRDVIRAGAVRGGQVRRGKRRVKHSGGTRRDAAGRQRNKRSYASRIHALGLTPEGAAARLGCSVETVRELCRGPLDWWPYGPGGRDRRISEDSLAAYQRSR